MAGLTRSDTQPTASVAAVKELFFVEYILKRESTAGGIGFFGCSPAASMSPPQALAHIKAHPNDEFMRRFVLRMLESMEPQEFAALVEQAVADGPDEFRALVCEASLTHSKFNGFTSRFDQFGLDRLASLTPLPLLRGETERGRALHRQWAALLQANLVRHTPFASAIAAGLDVPPTEPFPKNIQNVPPVHISSIPPSVDAASASVDLPTPETTARTALERLEALHVFNDAEFRHEASLSPVALLREWVLDLEVENRNLEYDLSGVQTSYGKGLCLEDARASLYMEIVERVSSFASVEGEKILNRSADLSLVYGSLDSLRSQGLAPLDPDRLNLDADYAGQAIHWMAGRTPADEQLWIPAQLVFLFCNLDEPVLTESPDSTGLASGNTTAQARLSGLYEVLERDAEAVGLYTPSRCFRPVSNDPVVGPLLKDYRARGIDVIVQDLTGEPDDSLGIPSYKAFVRGPSGEIAKGTGASLSGRAALLSALLETMYPYPDGEPSQPGPDDLPTRALEELPEYGTGHPDTDLALLEQLLRANGLQPVYMDLTRSDLRLPVCRAFVPGLAPAADFSAYTRIHPRQMRAARRFLKRGK
jgi:ribosomal protein S12 methylthiotransferase accessory factor YcaO